MCKPNKLEQWVVELFKQIEEAAEKGEDYNLHLDKELVQDIAYDTRSLEWIEMY